MAMVKAQDLRAKTPDELQSQLISLKKEAYNLRFQGASGQLENPARMRVVRREIARVKTIMAEPALDGVTLSKAKAPKAKAPKVKAVAASTPKASPKAKAATKTKASKAATSKAKASKAKASKAKVSKKATASKDSA